MAPNVGRLVDRIGPRVPAVVGSLFFFVGLVLLAQLDGESTVWDATWRVVFLGAGIGFAMPTMSAAAMGSLPPQVAGVGSGALNTLRQVGFSLGLAIVVAIFSNTIATNVRNGAPRPSSTCRRRRRCRRRQGSRWWRVCRRRRRTPARAAAEAPPA